jgi:serine/threonine-protein kinase
MLTGRKPFQADTSYSVLFAQMNETPTHPVQINPALPAELNDIVLHAMEKNPDARFQSADEFRNALKALRKQLAGQQIPQPVQQAQGVVPGASTAFAVAPQPQGFAPVAPIAPPVAPSQQGFTPVTPAGVPQPQGFAPVARPAAALRAGKSNRGLWIGLGALAAILALVAVATVLPRIYATYASQKHAAAMMGTQSQASSPDAGSATHQGTSVSDATQQPNPTGAATPEASPAPSTAMTPTSTATAPPSRPANNASNRPRQATASLTSSSAAGIAPSASIPPAAPVGPSPQEIRKVRDRLMNLDARASAAHSGVQQIRSQQQAQGLDIRGDILASMSRLSNDLSEANRALGKEDIQTADEYMDRADKEVSTLEAFMGR